MDRSFLTAQHSDETNPPTPADDCDTPSVERPSAVLLVARDRSLDESCRRTLSDVGVEVVVSVPSSQGALELLGTSELFDAVVISVGAGDVEAVKLAQHMRRYRSDTPTVVVSPIGTLRIPGGIGRNNSNRESNRPDNLDFFRATIRKAVAIRRSVRLRRPA